MGQNRRIRICFLGDVFSRHLLRWAKYFADRNYDVHIITFNHKIVDRYDNIKVHFIRKPIPSDKAIFRIINVIPIVFKAKKLIKEISPDLIHCHDAGSYSWVGAATGFHPVVMTAWGSDVLIYSKISIITRFFTKKSLINSDIVHCDGYGLKDELIRLGVDEMKIIILPFGVDVERFKPAGDKEKLKQQLNISGKVIISTRTLSPVHDIDSFIKAMPLILKKIPSARFIVVGYGLERARLEKLAVNLRINDFVKFTGIVSEDEMVSYLQISDVYVSNSLSESGVASSTAEAMACELPVINTNTGDIDLWLKEGDGGFIIPPKKPDIVAEKAIYILSNYEKFRNSARNNRIIIEAENNYYTQMAKMEKVYCRLMKEKDEKGDVTSFGSK